MTKDTWTRQDLEREVMSLTEYSREVRDQLGVVIAERDRLRKTLRHIQGHCGVPDAAEACRIVIKVAQEALEAKDGE